jgi:nicotinate-nucleotide adenylyltransferase
METGPAGRSGRPIRLGVFGGTFDPPHAGHVRVARDVADALALDRVLWIPARSPPHKTGTGISPPALRREMTAAACAADPRFEVSDVELRREGPSWTVDTLRALREAHPGAELYLILGADQVGTLADGWREPEEVLRLAVPVIMDREGESAAAAAPDLPGMERAVHVPVTRVDVSSTEVRARVRAGEDVSAMVPEGVLRVIVREGRYAGYIDPP